MESDIIKCMNPYCGREFKDTTKLKMQDSRNGRFINRCPYCHGVNTINTNENAVKRTKFIYIGDHETESHTKMNKRIIKPNLDVEVISKEVLGFRKKCDITEENKEFAPSYGRTLPTSEPNMDETFFQRYAATSFTSSMKPYTPQELMQQKINNRLEEMKSPPDNYRKYNHWWRNKHANK